MKIGVLSLQGAFAEHLQAVALLGADGLELRQKKDLEQHLDGIILPGGESTVQGKLLHELDMYNLLREKICQGLPVLGTCAGMILLAEKLLNDDKVHLATMPITVRRNAYGRQLGSFKVQSDFAGNQKIPMTFIRAPYIEQVGKDTQVLSVVDGHIVAAQYQKQLALAFHPELDLAESTYIHQYFLKLCAEK